MTYLTPKSHFRFEFPSKSPSQILPLTIADNSHTNPQHLSPDRCQGRGVLARKERFVSSPKNHFRIDSSHDHARQNGTPNIHPPAKFVCKTTTNSPTPSDDGTIPASCHLIPNTPQIQLQMLLASYPIELIQASHAVSHSKFIRENEHARP